MRHMSQQHSISFSPHMNINNGNNPIAIDGDDDDAMNFKMNIQKTTHHQPCSLINFFFYHWNNNQFLIKSSSRTPQTWLFFYLILFFFSFQKLIMRTPFKQQQSNIGAYTSFAIRCTFTTFNHSTIQSIDAFREILNVTVGPLIWYVYVFVYCIFACACVLISFCKN